MKQYKDVWRDGELYSEEIVDAEEIYVDEYKEPFYKRVVNSYKHRKEVSDKKEQADRDTFKAIASNSTIINYPEPARDYVHLIDNYEAGWQEMIDFLCSEESRKYFAKCRKLGLTAGLWAEYYGAHNKYYTFRVKGIYWFIWPWIIIGLILVGLRWLIL